MQTHNISGVILKSVENSSEKHENAIAYGTFITQY